MKLLFVTPYFYPKIGGVENYVYEISSRLTKKYNAEIVIVCSNWKNNKYKKEFINNIKVYRLPYLFKVSSTPINPFWVKKIDSIIEKENPNIVNGHFPVPYIADIAARSANKKGIPFILTYHNDLTGYNLLLKSLSKIYYYYLGYKTLDISRRIIVTSKYYAKNSPYLRRYHHKLRVVSPGVDIQKYNINPDRTDYLKRKYNLKNEKIVLFVGQLNKESRHKGLDFLIEAIKLINDMKNLKLIVVGDGNYINYYKNKVKSYKLTNKIIFTGYIEANNLPKYYKGSDVVVLPSYNRAEGFGMVLIEAQACGTPVIGTTVGGIPYVIVDGETGLLVPPRDPKALAKAIIHILSDENLLKKMGQAGYERVKKEFTWEKSTEFFLEVIKEVLNE